MLKQLGSAVGIVLLTTSFAFAGQTAPAGQAAPKDVKPAATETAKSAGQTTTAKSTANATKKHQKHHKRQAKAKASTQGQATSPTNKDAVKK